MENLKAVVVILICSIIFCTFIYGVGRSYWSWYLLRTKKAVNLSYGFGEQSMKGLLSLYAFTTSVTIYAIQSIDISDYLGQYKFLLILVNFLILTYLFFRNDWFRNSVVMPIWNGISKNWSCWLINRKKCALLLFAWTQKPVLTPRTFYLTWVRHKVA